VSADLSPEMVAKFTALRQLFEVQERGRLTAEQYRQLLRPIDPKRILHANRQSHVSQQDVTAHLTRIFGFEGWDKEIKELRLLRDVVETVPARTDEQGRTIPERQVPGVSYLCMLRLTIRDSQGRVVTIKEDVGTGTSPNLPDYGDAHDFASKNAVSYALKRCAKDLGDQYGLSLYNKGQRDALVRGSLMDPSLALAPETDVQAGVPQQVSMGDVEGGVDPETGEIAPQQDQTAEGRARQVAPVNGNGRAAQNGQSQPAAPSTLPVPKNGDLEGWRRYAIQGAARVGFSTPDGGPDEKAINAEYAKHMGAGAEFNQATIGDLRRFVEHLKALGRQRQAVPAQSPAGVAA
jgi:hypothetical protein